MTTIYVKGLSELQAFLDKLPAKMETNIMRGALRAGAKPIKEEAKRLAPVGEPNRENVRLYGGYEGALRDSIRISGRFDRKSGKLIAKVVAGGKSAKTNADVFYPIIVEFGTRPHNVIKNGSKYETNHPGTNENPFMRPALDTQAAASVLAAGEYIKKRLALKNGLDTVDINLEVEE